MIYFTFFSYFIAIYTTFIYDLPGLVCEEVWQLNNAHLHPCMSSHPGKVSSRDQDRCETGKKEISYNSTDTKQVYIHAQSHARSNRLISKKNGGGGGQYMYIATIMSVQSSLCLLDTFITINHKYSLGQTFEHFPFLATPVWIWFKMCHTNTNLFLKFCFLFLDLVTSLRIAHIDQFQSFLRMHPEI